ncbi:MAG: hypothetical protein WD342_11315 [Verrucomicrobiales bacterium]
MSVADETTNEALREALENKRTRFFRACRGEAKGKTGADDTALFAENLMVLQECAILLGEKLGMNAVACAVSYEDEETAGFCFNPDSDPNHPEVAGAIVNQRVPMQDFVASIRDFMNR